MHFIVTARVPGLWPYHNVEYLNFTYISRAVYRPGREDGSVSKSSCSISIQTWIWLLSTHVKSQAWLHMFVAPTLMGGGGWIPQGSLSSSLTDVLFSERPCLKTFSETGAKILHILPVLCTSKPRRVHLHAPHTCITRTRDKNTSQLVENGNLS